MSFPSPLTLWRDITPLAAPLKKPTSSSPHVLVIGGGVTGLVTSWVLLDQGYRVTILSKEWANTSKNMRLTSQIAGALWEYPPAVCGQHTDVISLTHSKGWSMTAYHVWEDAVEKNAGEHQKMKEIMAAGVTGFSRNKDLVEQHGVDPVHATDAYALFSPVIDTDKAMNWLMDLVKAKGASFLKETISEDLLHIEAKLRSRFGANVIINATGIYGGRLAGEANPCRPLRGAVIRILNDGVHFPKVKTALCMNADTLGEGQGFRFIIPRNDDILLLGGIAEPNEWELNLNLDSPSVKSIRERCEAFLPCLKTARVDPDYPLAQGLRPFRAGNVRVERELRQPGSRIIHTYGHGGSGWSLSFGCAQDVAMLTDEALKGVPAKTMPEAMHQQHTAPPIRSKL